MLFAASGLIGCPVAATDGRIGHVKDFLFDDRNWKVRWMVVDTGHWLPGRKVLIHPSVIDPLELPPKPAIPMLSFGETMAVSVHLAKGQIEASPEAREDGPVTEQMQQRLYDYYGWDPFWGAGLSGADGIVAPPSGRPVPAEVAEGRATDPEGPPGDPHLGSAAAVKGYAVHASDGDIGSVDNVLIDDVRGLVRYLVVDTGHWLPGKLVQLAPHAVTDIDWRGRRVDVNVTREQVRSAPAWDPLAMVDDIAEQRLHRHFGWPWSE
ncbi:MAG TPA: PRC-barrel domain-containing protein [Roseiarcus sp.]|nr:PRC-barrel domain-containing protein [Roseiarcus sp.]